MQDRELKRPLQAFELFLAGIPQGQNNLERAKVRYRQSRGLDKTYVLKLDERVWIKVVL